MSERRVFWLASGLLLLFSVAVGGLFALRRRTPTYPPDDPRRVVQAYLQALEQSDYAQASAYWDPQTWSDTHWLREQLRDSATWRQRYAVSIGAVRFLAPNKAVVLLQVTPLRLPPLLFPAETEALEAQLTRTEEGWRLVDLPPPWGVVHLPDGRGPLPAPPPATPGE